MSASLPILDDVRVASPCSEPWEAMTGDDRVRHCARCDLDVFNLSSMTREEAQAFVAEHAGAGRTCIRFYRRHDGTLLTRNCPVGWQRVQRRLMLAAAGVASLLGLAGVATVAGARTLSCHRGGSSAGNPFDMPLVRSIVALFTGQPVAQPRVFAGEMVAVPPPATPAPVPTPGSSTTAMP